MPRTAPYGSWTSPLSAERAVAAGATITRPLKNESDYESRGFSCTDPEGNHWSFGTYAG